MNRNVGYPAVLRSREYFFRPQLRLLHEHFHLCDLWISFFVTDSFIGYLKNYLLWLEYFLTYLMQPWFFSLTFLQVFKKFTALAPGGNLITAPPAPQNRYLRPTYSLHCAVHSTHALTRLLWFPDPVGHILLGSRYNFVKKWVGPSCHKKTASLIIFTLHFCKYFFRKLLLQGQCSLFLCRFLSITSIRGRIRNKLQYSEGTFN